MMIFHHFQGGLGSAVADVIASRSDITLKKLAVQEVPRSGPPEVLIDKFGIGARSIVQAIRELI